jgi:SAM-dependent methyltransferase
VTVPDGRSDGDTDGGGTDGGGTDDGSTDDSPGSGHQELPPDERELLAAFDRLSPEGSLRWGFDDAMRRVKASVAEVPDLQPWPGLPDDLWERGRSARVGERFVGDVAGVLAGLLADDARRSATEAVSTANRATWDALRYLEARLGRLEARLDPIGLVPSLPDLPAPEVGGRLADVLRFLRPSEGPGTGTTRTVVVGELGDRTLWDGISTGADHDDRVRGVDPRAAVVWRSWSAAGSGTDVVTAEIDAYLGSLEDDSVGAVVLSGCIDRFDLARKIELVGEALRVTAPGGRLVLLIGDQAAWEASLAPPVRDLLPSRPFHPETWELLLRHRGVSPRMLPPDGGTASAILAVVDS